MRIEVGETYDHPEYGTVLVAGITISGAYADSEGLHETGDVVVHFSIG